MRLILSLLVVVSLLPAFADEPKPAPEADKKPPEKKEEKKEEPEKPKEKAGSVTISGAEVKYLAQTGMLPVFKEDGTPRANVFYVYYAVTDKDGKRLATTAAGSRPITYCFQWRPGLRSRVAALRRAGPEARGPPARRTGACLGGRDRRQPELDSRYDRSRFHRSRRDWHQPRGEGRKAGAVLRCG
jgi:hypothetical protein